MDRDAELVEFLDKYYIGIDIDKTNNDQVVQFLSRIIKDEINKKDNEIDEEKLEKCSELLEMYTDEDILLSDQELEANFINIMGSKELPLENNSGRKSKRSRAFTLRIIGIAAIIVVISTLTLNTVAIANGYSNAWKFICDKASSLLKLDAGEQVSNNNITVTKNGSSKSYDSIETLFEAENIGFMYPHSLPDGVNILEIAIVEQEGLKDKILVRFSTASVYMIVDGNINIDLSLLSDCKTMLINSVTYYIFEVGEDKYQAICRLEGFEYTIAADDYEMLITIIESMGE